VIAGEQQAQLNATEDRYALHPLDLSPSDHFAALT